MEWGNVGMMEGRRGREITIRITIKIMIAAIDRIGNWERGERGALGRANEECFDLGVGGWKGWLSQRWG